MTDAKSDLDNLKHEFQEAATFLQTSVEVDAALNVRLARWSGQSPDGKKHQANLPDDETVFPFEGASDTRALLVDQVISDLTDLCVTAYSRANLRVGSTEFSDMGNAAVAETLITWIRKRAMAQHLAEAELCASHMLTYGYSFLQVSWEQARSLRLMKLSMDEIVQMSQQSDGVASELPALIANEDSEDMVAEILLGVFPSLKKSESLAAVRSLRKDGNAEFPVPYVCKNMPVVTALKPYDDIVFPSDTIDIQSARMVFRRMWMTEEMLRSKVADDGWDEGFVERCLENAVGSSSLSQTSSLDVIGNNSLADVENLVEIVWAYERRSNDEGIPAIYYTIFSPHVDGLAKNALLDYAHNEYPFVPFLNERISRRVADSRGVPHILSTWQNEVKAQRDSIHDYTSLSTLPPFQFLKRNGAPKQLGAGQGVPVTKIGDIAFMQPPARDPNAAFSVIRGIEKATNNYFGLPDPEIPPSATQMKAQRRMNNWLASWNEVYRQVLSLCVQYLPEEEIQRITNTQAVLGGDVEKYDITLSFNVQELDSDLAMKRLETILKVIVPLDVTGRLDRSNLVEFLTNVVAPEYAQKLLVDQPTASQQLYNTVKSDLAQMMLGFEAQLTDASNDPSAPTKLQYAQQISSGNPFVAQTVQSNEQVAKLFETYLKNLQMGVAQQQNKQIGRYGVDPNQSAQGA